MAKTAKRRPPIRYAATVDGLLVAAPSIGTRIDVQGQFLCMSCLSTGDNVDLDGIRQFMRDGAWLSCRTCRGAKLLERALVRGSLMMHVHTAIGDVPEAVGDWGGTFRYGPLVELTPRPHKAGLEWRFYFTGPGDVLWKGVWIASEARLRKGFNTFARCRRLTEKENLAFL